MNYRCAISWGNFNSCVCSSTKKKKSEHFTTGKKNKIKKNKNNQPKKAHTDKTPSEINPDLIHRPELQKKNAIHPSAMHGGLNTDFNNRYINTFLQRASECFINNVPTHIPPLSYQLTENQQLTSLSLRKFQWECSKLSLPRNNNFFFFPPHLTSFPPTCWFLGLRISINIFQWWLLHFYNALLQNRRHKPSIHPKEEFCQWSINTTNLHLPGQSSNSHKKKSQTIQLFSIYSFQSSLKYFSLEWGITSIL